MKKRIFKSVSTKLVIPRRTILIKIKAKSQRKNGVTLIGSCFSEVCGIWKDILVG
jgi:hypothetical protein